MKKNIIWLVCAFGFYAGNVWAAELPYNESPEYCGSCHQRIFEEWNSSMMGNKNLDDAVLYQFYTGTNSKGEKDGLGYQGMHPGEAGDCADCHVPTLALKEHHAGREADLGVAMRYKLDYGISCNFCHSVKAVHIAKDDNGRYRTGLSETVLRDESGIQYGPLKDAESPAHQTVFAPQFTQSESCAPCHLNQEKYLSISTYDDWKQAFDSGKTKETCQGCHMPLHKEAVVLAEGGPKRLGVRSHSFIGASDPGLLDKALSLDVATRIEGKELVVTTTVENVGAGHKVPGSGPLGNVILKIDAVGLDEKPLAYVGDPGGLLPSLAGTGDPATGKRGASDWAGLPGRMYAKVYQSAINPKTGKAMVGVGGFAADSVFFDTALKPLDANRSEFRFKLPTAHGQVNINVKLVYRWAFKPLADLKGWQVDDRKMKTLSRIVTW